MEILKHCKIDAILLFHSQHISSPELLHIGLFFQTINRCVLFIYLSRVSNQFLSKETLQIVQLLNSLFFRLYNMTINGRELMSVVVDICRKRNAKECITSSLKGGLLAGGACALGGLILGPVGLALGIHFHSIRCAFI